jgi:hypothetical protein
MTKCEIEGCPRTARPLSQFCERHLSMGPKELAIARAGSQPPRKFRAAKKSAAKRMTMKRPATGKTKSARPRKTRQSPRRSK